MSWDCPCHGNAAVFTPDKQTAFKAAVAEVAGVSTEDVALAEIAVHSSAKRRLLTEGIRVEVHVVAASKAAAEEIAQTLISRCFHPGCLPCLLYTSPSPRDGLLSRMPSSA